MLNTEMIRSISYLDCVRVCTHALGQSFNLYAELSVIRKLATFCTARNLAFHASSGDGTHWTVTILTCRED